MLGMGMYDIGQYLSELTSVFCSAESLGSCALQRAMCRLLFDDKRAPVRRPTSVWQNVERWALSSDPQLELRRTVN